MLRHFKLLEARFCPDCASIFCNKDDDMKDTDCPSCTNRLTVYLSDYIESLVKNKEAA
jgi:hypothetical protein